MRLGEPAKAAGLGLAVLALNLAATTAAIFVYAAAVAPGRPGSFYDAQAPRIAAWAAPIGGALLFLIALGWLGTRQPDRNPVAFALKAWLAYVVLDVGSGIAMGDGRAMLTWMMPVSMALALAGALAGAALSRRNPRPREQAA
jgi:hypothetical protein